MPTPTKGPRLGGSPSHQRHMLANLASQLFEHGRITTTEVRARRVQPLAETLITKAKRGDLHSRRKVYEKIRDRSVVHVLFTQIAPAVAEREGGYTRITKVGNRRGDNAPMAVIEVITEPVVKKQSSAKPKAAAPKAAVKAAPAVKAAVETKADVAGAVAAEATTVAGETEAAAESVAAEVADAAETVEEAATETAKKVADEA